MRALATALASAAPFGWFAAQPAPVHWPHAALPSAHALLWYPPQLRPLAGDPGTISFAQRDGDAYLAYLNVTPRQGRETLANWPAFRLDHQRDETVASSVSELGRATGLHFRGATGSCVSDTYVTRAKHNRFREIACLVVGRSGGAVVVAAAPPRRWKSAGALLERAVESFRVR